MSVESEFNQLTRNKNMKKSTYEMINRLNNLGFTFEEALKLRRISITLSRWAEAECNGEIQRDEQTGKPRRYYGQCMDHSYPCADREKGALKRLEKIVEGRNQRERHTSTGIVSAYHQTDPRGCSLYIIKQDDLSGLPIDQVYNRGVAVFA